MDHKRFKLGKDLLGIHDRLSVHSKDKSFEQMNIFVLSDLIDCNTEKDNETTAKLVIEHMQKMAMWEKRNLPEFKQSADYAIAGGISKAYEKLGWSNSSLDINICQGHNTSNGSKTTEKTVHFCIEHDIPEGTSNFQILLVLSKILSNFHFSVWFGKRFNILA